MISILKVNLQIIHTGSQHRVQVFLSRLRRVLGFGLRRYRGADRRVVLRLLVYGLLLEPKRQEKCRGRAGCRTNGDGKDAVAPTDAHAAQ